MKKIMEMVILTVCIVGASVNVLAGEATLSWSPNSEADLEGYRIYYGTRSRSYGPYVFTGKATTYTVEELQEGQTYYFALTAVDSAGNESGYSAEGSKMIPVSIPDPIPLPAAGPYGKLSAGDPAYINAVGFSFGGTSGDVTVQYEMWDVDSKGEVEIFFNGQSMGNAPPTANGAWSGVNILNLPDELVLDGATNILTFSNTCNPPNEYWWAVRNVSYSSGTYLIPLPAAGPYGYGSLPESDPAYVQEVNFSFGGMTGDAKIHYEVWDVDASKEVEVSFNGVTIGYAPVTANRAWSGENLLSFPDEIVNDSGKNILTFSNTGNPPNNYWWAVRNVSCSSGPCLIPLPAADAYGCGSFSESDLAYIHEANFSFGGRAGDVTVVYEPFDVDSDQEVEVRVNGHHVCYVPVTGNNKWAGPMTAVLPDAYVYASGTNVVTFNNTGNPPNTWRWGVRGVRVE